MAFSKTVKNDPYLSHAGPLCSKPLMKEVD